MMAIDRVRVACLDEIAPGQGRPFTLGALELALFNADGRLFAIDDWCIRCGGSLASGTLRDRAVICARCAWKYDLATGIVNDLPALRVDTFEVKVIESDVIVELPAE